MDKTLLEYLDKNKIAYIIHKHPAIFTVAEHKKLMKENPNYMHTKNLFLKDTNNDFYLVSMFAEKRLDMKKLASFFDVKKLTFGSAEELKKYLNITPGSVSIFCMIYANLVRLIIDEQVWKAKKVGFHPNDNKATLELTHENLKKFYNSLKAEKIILDL